MSKIPVRGLRPAGSGLPRLATRLPRPSTARDAAAERTPPPPALRPGDPVLVDGEPGTLRFLGHTLFAEGLWAGVELARPIGKNDGSVGGRRYFFCQRGHGLFAPPDMVSLYEPARPPPPPQPAALPRPADEPAPAPRRRRPEELELPLASSTPACAGAAAASPAGDLWWDPDSIEDNVDDELLQDIELDEFSLGILTPDQMDDDSHLLMRSEDFSRSLGLLASPAGAPTSPADLNRTFTVDAEQSADEEPHLVRLTSDDGAALNVTVSVDREPDWEDEFDADATLRQARAAPSRPEPSELVLQRDEAPQPEAAASPGPASEPQAPPEDAAPGEPPSPSPSADQTFDVTAGAAHVTSSMSSESSDVTLKDESSGAGEALADPPSPEAEAMVLVRPAAAQVTESACAPPPPAADAVNVPLPVQVCEPPESAEQSNVQRPQGVQEVPGVEPKATLEPQEPHGVQEVPELEPKATMEPQEPQQPGKPPEQRDKKTLVTGSPAVERKKDSCGPERKSVVFSEPEVHRPDPVTSCATSTTSIDGGYQGDSEFDTGTPSEDPARPPPRLDVLTDSDFCSEGAPGTESEPEHRLTDDMESSGVYSDAESRRSAEPDREPIEAIEETEETMLSPVKETQAEHEPPPLESASGAAGAADGGGVSTEPGPARRRDPIPSHVVRPREPPPKKDPIKMNHPLPRRNVQSKLRSLLEAPSPAAETRRPQRAARKGRWDAVMSRIEQNKSEEKTRPRREVKSRLYEGVTPAKETQHGSRRSLVSGRNSRTGSTHTLTGSRTSLRPAGSRSVSPAFSGVSSASSGSARSHGSRGSMNSRGSSKQAAKTRAGSIPSPAAARTYIPALRLAPGSGPTTACSGGKQSAAVSKPVPAAAARAALEAPPRRHPAVLSNKTNIASNHTQATKTTKAPTRTPTSGRSQNKVQSKSATKDAKPVPIKASGPAAAAAAARHEVKVTQLEDQLASHQRDLQATRGDLQHAARCFDAAMVMVNYLSNEYNPFQLTEEVKALQSRATEIQLALDEAAATQRRLEESLEERERARQERETEVSAELAALTSQHQTALESSRQELADVRAAWHQERQLLEQDLRQQQEARDRDLRQLSSQHQQTLASVTAQWERELAEGQRRSQQQADQLRGQIAALEEQTCELSRREEELKVALGKSSDTRIQVLSARIKEKEKDVRSLNAVLELKKEEIAALRRDQLELQRLRERNARLEESCTKYRAKAEDLEAQLRQRALAERQLSEENTRLRDCQDREAKAYKRLSMENEQLQYKLRNQSDSQGTPGVLSRSASFRSPRTPTSFTRACSESPHTSRISPRSPLKSDSLRRRSRRSEEASPPPQVTAVVEKSDSISWVLDMEASGRGSSAEPDEAGEPSADRRLGPRAGSRSPPSAKGLNGAGSESSDSDAADHDNGVFYQLGGPASAPGSLTVSLPDQHDMHDIPESSEGTEI